MVSSREPLPEHREPLPEHRDEGVSATSQQQQQQQQQQHGEPARQRTKGPSRARNLGRAADGNRRGAFVGEPGTGSSWPTGKETDGGQCRRVLNTPHQAGSKHGGMGIVCAHCPDDVRTRGQECPGAEALALSTLRLTALAKTQGGASQRPSVLAEPMFVCCCVGQAKVNGATIVKRRFLRRSPTDEQ